jgi:hypothetical protein
MSSPLNFSFNGIVLTAPGEDHPNKTKQVRNITDQPTCLAEGKKFTNFKASVVVTDDWASSVVFRLQRASS